MPRYRKSQLLARVNFPPYTVHCLTERHVLVAGGGGSSKTGIRNVIEIYELQYDGLGGCKAKSVAHYETGDLAIMNCAIFNAKSSFILFAGMEGLCQLYKLKYKIQRPESMPNGLAENAKSESEAGAVLRARGTTNKTQSDTPDLLNENASSQSCDEEKFDKAYDYPFDLVLDVTPLKSFQTDYSDDPFQKLTKFCSITKMLATAGSDGHIRMWKYPGMEKLHDIHAHQDDVDDLDFSPSGDRVVSVSRDGHGKVWNSKDGILVSELKYELPTGKSDSKYTFKGCRYGIIEGNTTNIALYITLNPCMRKKPPLSTFLSKWNGNTFVVEKIVSAGYEMLSSICISDDGNFIGLGTQEGSVKIYIAFSLQLLYRADHVHSIFVTGLEFLPSCQSSKRITGDHEASLVSISVDNHINIHYIPYRGTVGAFTIVILFIITLFLIFIIMDCLNL